MFFIGLWQTTMFGNTTAYCDSIIKVSVDLMHSKKHVASLGLLAEVKEIAEKNKWYKQLFLAQNNIGNNYFMLLDYGEALKQYLESYKTATTYLDGTETMIVLNNIAILYSKEKKYDQANTHFNKAFVLAKKHNDSLKMGLYSMNLGLLANEENKLTKARNFFKKSLQFTETPEIRVATLVGLYTNELLQGNTLEARLNAEKLLSNLKEEQNNDNRIDLSVLIARAYLTENDLSEALKWTNATFLESPDLEKKIDLYDLLSHIYFRLKSYNLAFQYKDSVALSNIKFNTIKNGKLYESSEIKFQIQNYKEKIIEKDTRNKNERKLFYFILIAIIFALIILVLIFRNYTVKMKQKQVLAKREQQITAVKLEKEKAENQLLIEKEKTAILERESLQNDIQLKNQKILSKVLYISGRNQLLQDIIKSFATHSTIKENSTFKKDIQALKEHIKTDDSWENYVRHFDEVNQGFIKRLTEKHADLTVTDIRYISYVYMNLDTKEIATMLNITPAACRKRKERIEKRLELPAGVSFYSYLLSI